MTGLDGDWSGYLSGFHDQRPGVTEALLSCAADDGATVYDWLAEPVPHGARVLDLACGTAPTASRLAPASYVGVDLSPGELVLARRRGLPVVQADATRLPLPDASVDSVVMSMALQVVPLDETLREVRRVLAPGGLLVATVPVAEPMPARDALRWARLCLALGVRGVSYPNDDILDDPRRPFSAAGLALEHDERRAYPYGVVDRVAADLLLDALYLPGVPPQRLDAGRRVVHSWVGRHTTVPLRRLVARG